MGRHTVVPDHEQDLGNGGTEGATLEKSFEMTEDYIGTWMNEMGKNNNINFLQVLQEVLKRELGID